MEGFFMDVSELKPISIELLHLIYNGNTNQQIADKLFFSVNTVKKHINHAYLKLDSTSRAGTIARLRQLME